MNNLIVKARQRGTALINMMAVPHGVDAFYQQWSQARLQPTRVTLALLGVYAWHMTHRMQPDVLDADLMQFIASEASPFRRLLQSRNDGHSHTYMVQAGTYFIDGVNVGSFPNGRAKLTGLELRAARMRLAMWRHLWW